VDPNCTNATCGQHGEEEHDRGEREHEHGHGEQDELLYRTESCMIFVCIDNVTGNYTWYPAPNGTACGHRHSCDLACDGAGYCKLKPGAPLKCHEEEEGKLNPAILVGIILPIAAVVLASVLAIAIVLGGRRWRRRRYEPM
jgi:hypothetical protein